MPAPFGNKNWLGKIQSETTRLKISNTLKGRKLPKELCERLSVIQLKRFEDPNERKKLSIAQTGRIVSNETRKKIGERHKGRIISEDQRQKQRKKMLGRKLPEDHKRKIRQNTPRGEKSPHWRGGISYFPYCPKFNYPFKERVRIFFGRVCVECGKTEKENGRRLDVHHVNYDKMVCCNGVKPLFVVLCRHHNTLANGDRKYWENHYTKIIELKYGGKCYATP